MLSVFRALSVPAFHFFLPVSPAHKGHRHLWNASPDSDPQQVRRLCAASVSLPWEGKHDQPPTGCVCAPFWSLVSFPLQPGGCSRAHKGPSFHCHATVRVIPCLQAAMLGRTIFSFRLLNPKPYHAHVEIFPYGLPRGSDA